MVVCLIMYNKNNPDLLWLHYLLYYLPLLAVSVEVGDEIVVVSVGEECAEDIEDVFSVIVDAVGIVEENMAGIVDDILQRLVSNGILVYGTKLTVKPESSTSTWKLRINIVRSASMKKWRVGACNSHIKQNIIMLFLILEYIDHTHNALNIE